MLCDYPMEMFWSGGLATTVKLPGSSLRAIEMPGFSRSAPMGGTWHREIIPAVPWLSGTLTEKLCACLISLVRPVRQPDSPPTAAGSPLPTWTTRFVVYDLTSGEAGRTWACDSAPAQDLAYRPDGKQLAVVYRGNPPICAILDADTGRNLRAIPLPSVGSVAWSLDGTMIATTGSNSRLSIWNAATGERDFSLEMAIDKGLRVAFHPAGTLVATNGWEAELRLWDPVVGRQILNLTCQNDPEFTRDGRTFVRQGSAITPWQIDPALEYRTLTYASVPPQKYFRPSIHRDGRLLAVTTEAGVVLWDLARGAGACFPADRPRSTARSAARETWLTNGSAGVLNWPFRVDQMSGEVGIGPPRTLPLPGTRCEIAEDRTGQIVAVAAQGAAFVAMPNRTTPVRPLDDCRRLSVSPDGKWLATGCFQIKGGVAIWRLPDGDKAAKLPVDGGVAPYFSPDGKWLMTRGTTSRVFEVGTWREVRQIDGIIRCISANGRLVVVLDANKVLRLVEIDSG